MFKGCLVAAALGLYIFCLPVSGIAEQDMIVETAINMARVHMRIPKDMEIKFLEKKESPIEGFQSVKLLVVTPDREVPIVIYVDREAQRLIVGSLIIKGENVTVKEAGSPRPRKIDMTQLDLDKSPFRGKVDAAVTIVEFSNFQCPYCLRSWTAMKDILNRRPGDLKYIFKHYPLQTQGKPFEISEMAAATQEVGNEAFWLVHDFLFTKEGQDILSKDRDSIKQKIVQVLKENHYDERIFLEALVKGTARKRVEDDRAIGNKIRVRGTPTTIMNGEVVRAPITDQLIDQYLKRQ